MPDFGKVGSLSNFYLGAQTIQRGKLLFRFSSRCANYSRERSNQGGILFKEIRYIVITRKYPLRGYILGSGVPGTPGSSLRLMEQLLLVTSCDSPAGIGASLRTHVRTD